MILSGCSRNGWHLVDNRSLANFCYGQACSSNFSIMENMKRHRGRGYLTPQTFQQSSVFDLQETVNPSFFLLLRAIWYGRTLPYTGWLMWTRRPLQTCGEKEFNTGLIQWMQSTHNDSTHVTMFRHPSKLSVPGGLPGRRLYCAKPGCCVPRRHWKSSLHGLT